MTVKLSSLRANLKRETDGDWIDIPDLPGVALLVRSFHYGPFQAAKQQIEQKWARQYAGRGAPPEIVFRANGRLYAAHLLLGWRGFDQPWNEAVAEETLTDPEFRELHEHIRYASNRVSEIETEFVEAAEKNSARSSAGSSTAAAE